MTTLAEDIVLLLLDPQSGRPMVDRTSMDRVVGGALLLDLSLRDRITADGDGARAKLTVAGKASTGDMMLDAALARLGTGPLRAQRAVERLARKTREPVLERLVARGLVVPRTGRVLGIFPTTSWPTADPRTSDALRARVAAVLLRKAEPDQHLACLISLVHAVRAEHKLADGRRRDLRERAAEISDGEWAGAAVRKAVQTVHASVAAAASAGAVAGSAGGS